MLNRIPVPKQIAICCISSLLCITAFPQNNWFSGIITEANGNPVQFATITLKEKNNSIAAKADGSFIIKALATDSIVISAVGFNTAVFILKNESDALYVLNTNTNMLPVVTVTSAFNIKKEKQVTPYNAQLISAETLNIIPQTNVNDALIGKIAGVQFRGQSGAKLNSHAFERVRGGLLVSGDIGRPAFVVDGTIVSDANGIDPSAIENITVLKGANATAIFGGLASGAIVITTKKAKYNRSSIQFNQGFTVDKVGRMPAFQNSYAGGYFTELAQYAWQPGHPEEWKALDGKYFHDYTDDGSWGPKMEGQEYVPWYAWVPGHKYSFTTAKLVPQPDNIKDFWETGLTSNTNLNFTKSGQGYNTRISFTKQFIQGVIPNSKSDNNIISGNLNIDVNKFISAGVDFSYSRQTVQGDFNDGFINTTTGNFYQWNQRDLDMGIMKELKSLLTPVGTTATWNWRSNPTAYNPADPVAFYRCNYWFNFYTFLDNELKKENTSRLFGSAYIKANINADLDVKGTVRIDESILSTEMRVNSILWPLIDAYETSKQSTTRINYELLLTYHKIIGKSVKLNAFGGVNTTSFNSNGLIGGTQGGLYIPDLYALSNSVLTPSVGNGRLKSKSNAVFASADATYQDFIAISLAARQVWHSTLPEDDNDLFCPSAGVSFLPFNLSHKQPGWLSSLKLYASWGKTPITLGIYQTNTLFYINGNPWNGNFLMTAANVVPDKNLKGGLITSYETGIDFSLFKNRIGLNATYYSETAADQPVQINVDATSGLTAKSINASTVKRQGLEFLFNAIPIKGKNFSWNISVPLGWLLNNPVTKIIEGQERIQPSGWKSGLDRNSFASAYQVLDEDWGQLIGGGYARNEEGIPLIDPATGKYITGDANYAYGSIVPKLTGGLQSFLTYKNLFFNFSLDFQQGGKFYSCSEYWGNYSGTLAPTALINDKGMNVRDAVEDGGGVHVTGVSSVDGKTPVEMYVKAYDYYRQFRSTSIAEPYIHSLSYVKLREVSVGYRLPVNKWKFTSSYMQNASIAFIARNPLLIYSAAKNFDPSEISFIYGEEGQLPPTRSWGLSLNVTF